MMKKIDIGREWSRVAPTQRVSRIKHEKEERHPRRHPQHSPDESDEKQHGAKDKPAAAPVKDKKLGHRKQDRQISSHKRVSKKGDDQTVTEPTGKRINIRI